MFKIFKYDENDYFSCKTALKNCNRYYQVAGVAYLFVIILTVFMDLYFMIMSPNPTFLFIDLIGKVACFYFGFMKGLTDKKNSGCLIGAILHGITFLILSVGGTLLDEIIKSPGDGLSAYFTNYVLSYNTLSTTMIPLLIVSIFINDNYNALSKVKGFPQFNELIEQHKEESKIDRYKEYYEELKAKKVSGPMDNLDTDDENFLEEKVTEKNNFMEEIDLTIKSNDLEIKKSVQEKK